VQVPTGTVGSGTGDGSGQVVVDNGLTFECETLPSSTPSTGSNTNTNSNTNNNSNTTNVGIHNNISNTNTLSQKQQQNQNQSQTATGGSASSTSNATGGTSSASATGNGDGSNNSTSIYDAAHIPVSTAVAPPILPTAPCTKGYSGGGQGASLGLSGGFARIDQGCDDRELARAFSGPQTIASCKILVYGDKNQKRAKKHPEQAVTMEDCLRGQRVQVVIKEVPAPVVAPMIQPVAITVPVTIVNPLPAPPEYRTVIDVVAPKKKAVHHLPPNCQNVLVQKCTQEK
jgi:hypothetical protein